MNVMLPLAQGVEEMEAVIVVDTLRRANWNVSIVGLDSGMVTASRGVRLGPDLVWENADPRRFDMIILPGGMAGTLALRQDPRVLDCLRAFAGEGKWVGAICAAALVLDRAGLLADKRFTCYPGVGEGALDERRSDERVVVDGRLVTSQGPGTALDFALTLIRVAQDEETAARVAAGMLYEGSGWRSGVSVGEECLG